MKDINCHIGDKPKEYLFLVKYEDDKSWLVMCTQNEIDEVQKEALSYIPHLTDEPILKVYRHVPTSSCKICRKIVGELIYGLNELKSELRKYFIN